MTDRIFSGDYSRKMWHEINSAENVEDLRNALYLVCCRLQELEARHYAAQRAASDSGFTPQPGSDVARCVGW